MNDPFLLELQTTEDLAEKAALIADAILEMLANETALIARQCLILHWFDKNILQEIISSSNIYEEIYQQIASLPFIESVAGGLRFNDLTRKGLLKKYTRTQPALLINAAKMMAPLYEKQESYGSNAAEAFFCYMVSNNTGAARKLLDKLLDGSLSREDWQYITGLLRLRDEAEQLSFVQSFPLTERQWILKGLAHRVQSEQDAAIAAYLQAVEYNNENSLSHMMLGAMYVDQQRYEEALQEYNTVIKLDGGRLQAYINKGIVYLRWSQDDIKALQCFEEALQIDPNNTDAKRYRQQILEKRLPGANSVREIATIVAQEAQDNLNDKPLARILKKNSLKRSISSFLRKLFGHQRSPLLAEQVIDLERFYTYSGSASRYFEQLLTTTNPSKNLMMIHGLGGVGKSSLLKMYELSCRRLSIPVALVDSEEASSPVDVLAEWEADLNYNGIALPTFQKTLRHYRAIQAKVEAEEKKGHLSGLQVAGTLGKTAAKTVIGIATSAIPIVGPIMRFSGGESAEAFIDRLRGFLTESDIRLLLDPERRLNDVFLSDLARVADRQQIVLMADTYEQMTTMDDWMRELARRLPKNILLVLAGRAVPAWDRAWQGWMGKAEIIEIKEMTSDDIRILVHRYYEYIRSGEPDPRQVEAIVQFARGLPMVATTAVQLWVKYGLEDFQTVRPQVVDDVVDRLLEGVPQEMRPAIEVAAILRYFNVDALNALLESGGAEVLYAELRRLPFIRPRKEGLAVHDTMREMINEALNLRTPGRFRTLHERAAVYYETKLGKATGEERERYILERLYHSVRADENGGMQLFQELAEELTRYRMVNRLRVLLNDVNTYPLERENSQVWRKYYNARLAHLESRISHAEWIYQAIAENEHVEPRLRAYASCDWGEILCRRERLHQPGVEEKTIQILQSSLNLGVTTNLKLAMSWVYLSDIYIARAEWEKALFHLDQPRKFFVESSDFDGLLTVLSQERGIYLRQGDLRKTFDIEKEMWKTYTLAGEPTYLRARLSQPWEFLWVGRYAESEENSRVVQEVAWSLQDQELICWKTCDLALSLGLQARCAESLAKAQEGLTLARDLDSIGAMQVFVALSIYGIVCLKCGELNKAKEYLTQAIQLGKELHTHLDITPLYLAITYEILNKYDEAGRLYEEVQMETHQSGRHLFECDTLASLVRVKLAQHDYAAIPQLWTEAERLAQQYEYNDYFTSLYLSRGHITWDGLITEWGEGFETALHYYQLVLIHALRFNRFLLDEALSGHEQGTPLRPIIPHCLERGKEGHRMLAALRDWWQSGKNDIGTPRPDTISPIPEGIALSEGERIARTREPGDGSQQKSVVEQINRALTMAHGES